MALPIPLATHRKSMRSIVLSLALIIPCIALAQNKDAGKALNEFFEAEWNYEMEQSPARASSMGDRRWNDRWGDQSLDAIQKREAHAKEAVERLKKFDRAQLSPADQLNYDLFRKDLEQDIEGFKSRSYLMPINQRGGIQTLDELGDRLRFETLKDFEDWVARLRALPALMDQTVALMKQGARAQIMWRLFHGERAEGRERHRQRNRPLHFDARPGARLQNRRAE